MNCEKLNKKEQIKLALKYNISKEKIKESDDLCKLIKKEYNKKYPCNNLINKETSIQVKRHQFNVSNNLIDNRGLILFHEVGTGKTMSSIIASRCLLLSKIINKVIVITPTSLQENFKKELLKYDPDIDISNYYYYTIQGLTYALKNKTTVENCKNALVIIDEAHNLRASDSSQFEEIYKYCSHAKKILLLTATPLINSKYDIINLIALIKNEEPITKKEFDEMDDKDFKIYLSNVFNIYIKSSDKHFPDKKIVEIFLKMDNDYLKKYNKIENGEVKKFPQFNNKNTTVFYNGVRRASNIIDDDSEKINWIINKILDNKKSKFVIFSHFISMGLEPIKKILDKHNIKYESITGDLNKNERKNAVIAYNNADVNILFISKSGSEGLDLKNTNFIIIMESSWNENEINQIIGRGVRYKSHETCNNKLVIIYKLFLVKPVEYENIKFITNNLLLDYKDNLLSVDLYLRNYSILKQQHIEEFYNTLKKMV
jgi:superfamily II DNA or RNA helicase